MGWWFGRKAAPEPARPIVPAWLSASEGQGFVRSYEAQFDEVYRNNPVGQRAVRLVSGLLGSLTVYAAEGDEKAAELVSGEGLIEGIGAALLLHGNAYVQLLTDADEKPAELVLLRPERVSVETDAQGWPIAYKYRAGGKTVRLARADGLGRTLIAHVRSLHPRDDHYGMGCLDAAIAAASVHNRASRWNKGLLDNAARPSGALTYQPEDGSLLSAEQFARLKAELESEFPPPNHSRKTGPSNWRWARALRVRRRGPTGSAQLSVARPSSTGNRNAHVGAIPPSQRQAKTRRGRAALRDCARPDAPSDQLWRQLRPRRRAAPADR